MNRYDETTRSDTTTGEPEEPVAEPGQTAPPPGDKASTMVETGDEDLIGRLQEAERIPIDTNTFLFVDGGSGDIQGPIAEGTTAIIFFAGTTNLIQRGGFDKAQAIRVPRLLHLDGLLNFHTAEISFHENQQASMAPDSAGLQVPKSSFRTSEAKDIRFPGDDTGSRHAYIGFYLSPNASYRVVLVARDKVWPRHFADYLEQQNEKPDRLYEAIARHTDGDPSAERKTSFENLLFLPDHRFAGAQGPSALEKSDDGFGTDEGPLRCLGRSRIVDTYSGKDVGGWWFNVPICRYTWLTTDLERLLTGLVEEDDTDPASQTAQGLSGWGIADWLKMLTNLAVGLTDLHGAGLVHGDPRPANIMAVILDRNRPQPINFRWIDVGLGFSHGTDGTSSSDPNAKPLAATPAPLGGGRVTPFYAPERLESVEFEDADLVRLSRDEAGVYRLRFYWRRRTYEAPRLLRLKDGDKPLRELGALRAGDRVQLREFIFDVASVEADCLVISRICELVMDRVLIEHTDSTVAESIHRKLREVAISRYRIFKQWSEATDIYGLGVIVLYVFFLRGLYGVTHAGKADPDGDGRHGDKNLERSARERAFQELAALLRSHSFLSAFIDTLGEGDGYTRKEELWQAEVLRPWAGPTDATGTQNGKDTHEARIQRVVEYVLAMDNNFNILLFGLNMNKGLFVLVLYFCLCCVWRQDEVKRTDSGFPFLPYCRSRRRIAQDGADRQPAALAQDDLEKILTLINNAGINDEMDFANLKPEDLGLSIPGSSDPVMERMKQSRIVKNLEIEKQQLVANLKDLKDKIGQVREAQEHLRGAFNEDKKAIELTRSKRIQDLLDENSEQSRLISALRKTEVSLSTQYERIPGAVRWLFAQRRQKQD